jgi:hypothetical protein
VFSVGADPRLYNEDSRPVELELKEPLEAAVADGGEEEIYYVMQWLVKCSNQICTCAINPAINPKPSVSHAHP